MGRASLRLNAQRGPRLMPSHTVFCRSWGVAAQESDHGAQRGMREDFSRQQASFGTSRKKICRARKSLLGSRASSWRLGLAHSGHV